MKIQGFRFIVWVAATVALAGCVTSADPDMFTEPMTAETQPQENAPPPPSAARAFVTGQRAWDNQELAIDAFTLAVEIDPAFAVAYFERAHLFRKTGQIDRAIDDYSRAIEADPGFIQAYLERGFLRLWDLGDEGGREDVEIAYSIDPNDMEAGLGYAGLIEWDDPRAAFEIFDRLSEIHPLNPEPFLRSAKLHRGLGDYDAAIEAFNGAIDRGLGDPWVRSELAMLLVVTNREREARRQLELAREMDPESPEVALVGARLSVLSGDPRPAAPLYARYLESEWVDYSAYLEAASVAAHAGDLDRAEQLIRRFAEISDDPLRARLFAGGAAALAGNESEAVSMAVSVIGEAEWYWPAWIMLAALTENGAKAPAGIREQLTIKANEIRPEIRRILIENTDLLVWVRLYGADF